MPFAIEPSTRPAAARPTINSFARSVPDHPNIQCRRSPWGVRVVGNAEGAPNPCPVSASGSRPRIIRRMTCRTRCRHALRGAAPLPVRLSEFTRNESQSKHPQRVEINTRRWLTFCSRRTADSPLAEGTIGSLWPRDASRLGAWATVGISVGACMARRPARGVRRRYPYDGGGPGQATPGAGASSATSALSMSSWICGELVVSRITWVCFSLMTSTNRAASSCGSAAASKVR